MVMTPRTVTIDRAGPGRLTGFWTEAAGSRGQDNGHDFVVAEPAAAGGLNLGLLKVPGGRAAMYRVHVDRHTDDRPAQMERRTTLGATGGESVPGLTWTVMADPDGNEFCVTG